MKNVTMQIKNGIIKENNVGVQIEYAYESNKLIAWKVTTEFGDVVSSEDFEFEEIEEIEKGIEWK